MFGPIMRFTVGELNIELAPLTREDMPQFIENGGLQNFEVTKYLGRAQAPVLEDEYEWFEKVRTDKASVAWGIFVIEDGQRELIGNTSLNSINREVMSYATSGFMIFRPEYWGKGIATCCHRARTWYAFTQMNLVQVRSAAYDVNIGSCRALKRTGYVHVFHERNAGYVNGEYIGLTGFSLINPLELQWNLWWHGDRIPPAYFGARKRAQAALNWVDNNVSFG